MNKQESKIPQWLAVILKILKCFAISIAGVILLVAIMCVPYYVGEYNTPDLLNYVVNSDQKTCTVTGAKDPSTLVLRIPEEIDGYTVTRIAPAAFKENDMQTVILPDTIEVIGDSAFYACVNLMKVEGINDCVSLINIEDNAFAYCDSLISMKLPDSIQSIGDYAFYVCEMWRDATIPLNTEQIGVCAYAGCFAIKEIYIPKFVKTIGEMAFLGCEQLVDIDVAEENPYWSSADGTLYDKEMKTLYCYPIGRNNQVFIVPEGVENIHYKAFALNFNLKEIHLPTTIKKIGEEVLISAKGVNSKITTLNYAGSVEMWQAIDNPKNWGQYSSDFIIYCTDGQIAKDGTVTYN